MNAEFAGRLQQLRKSNGLSQEELAEKIGVSRQAVSKWERAEASPDTENLILLSGLYRMSLDELVNPNNKPVSLKKEDTVREMRPENYTEEEIYPGHTAEENNSVPQGAPFGEDIGEEEKQRIKGGLGDAVSKAGLAVGDIINAAADGKGKEIPDRIAKAGRAMGDVIGAAGQKISEEAKRPDLEDRVEQKMEKLGNSIEKMGRSIENKFDKWGEKMEEKERRHGYSDPSEPYRGSKGKKKRKSKPPMTLFDKLFPIIIISMFLFSIALNIPHWGWVLFLLIPLYYTTKEALRKRNIALFCYPLLCAVIYFGIGIPLMDLWRGLGYLWMETMWLLFLTIPLFYTGIAAVKKRNPLIFCYPVLCVIVYLAVGIFFDSFLGYEEGFLFMLPIFMTIPVYYIVISHYRQKAKAAKGTHGTVSSAVD